MPTYLTFGDDIFSLITNDTIYGLAGNDSLTDLTTGSNHIFGNSGNDTLSGRSRDTLVGGQGNDFLEVGYADRTRLFGGAGNDEVFTAGMNDSLYGGSGNDTLESAEFGGENLLIGGEGNDVLFTDFNYSGTLIGGLGNDDLSVSTSIGNNWLIGVALLRPNPGVGEVDTLTGGIGLDTFVLGTSSTAFYDDGNRQTAGTGDYAVIVGCQNEGTDHDFIQLHGTPTDYVLGTSPIPGLSGTAIYLNNPLVGPDELIAIVQGAEFPGFTLNSSWVNYV